MSDYSDSFNEWHDQNSYDVEAQERGNAVEEEDERKRNDRITDDAVNGGKDHPIRRFFGL